MYSAFVFIVTHYVAIAILAMLCCGLGCTLTRGQIYHSLWEKIAMTTSLGLGVIATLVFVLGLLHYLYSAVVFGVLIVIGVISIPALAQAGRELVERFRISGRSNAATVIVALLFLIAIGTDPLYPPFFPDATSYHLALAKISAQSHQVTVAPYLRFPVFPILNEMLFSLALIVYDDILAQLVQFLAMLLVAVALFAWAERTFPSHVGLLAAALWLGTPLVIWVGTAAGVDVGLTLFVTVAVYAFFNWMRGKEKGWLILSAVLTGFAAGSKYSALFFLGCLGLATLYQGMRDREWTYPVIFGAISASVAAPWYLYDWYYTGNPFFPFFGNIFGYRIWSAEDVRVVMAELESWGTGKTLSSLLLLPWNLVFDQQSFHLTEARLLPFYIPALPLAAVVSIRIRSLRGLVLLSIGYVVYWFQSAQILRYLLPVLPLLCLLTAALFERGVRLLSFLRQPRVYGGLVALIVVALLSVGAVYDGVRRSRDLGRLPVKPAERDIFYPNAWITYDAFKILNSQNGTDYTVYALGNSYMAYFAEGTFIGDSFGPARYDDVVKLASGQELYQKLVSLNATYLLVDLSRTSFMFPQWHLPHDQFFQEHFKLVYTRPLVRLYELVNVPLRRASEPELLQNASFEEMEDGNPKDWVPVGTPLVDDSVANSHTGARAVQSQGNLNAYFQVVAVKPGAVYLLEQYARATEQNQRLRLQVDWYDARDTFLGTSKEVVRASPAWTYHEAAVTAPNESASARVYASAEGQSTIWFDDLSFTELKYEPN